MFMQDTSHVKKHSDNQSENIECLFLAHMIKRMTVILKGQLKYRGRHWRGEMNTESPSPRSLKQKIERGLCCDW